MMWTKAPNVIEQVSNDLWWEGKTMSDGMRSRLEARQEEIEEDFVPEQVWECRICGCKTHDARVIEDEHCHPQYVCPDCVKDAVDTIKESCEPIISEYLVWILEDLWRADR